MPPRERFSDGSDLRRRGPNEHTLVETTTLAGGAVGAVVGIAAGPPGMAAGVAIGAAIGLAAGTLLAREDARAEDHDRDRDAARGETNEQLAARLRSDHAQLEVFYAALVDSYRLGDWEGVRVKWNQFENGLRDHMAREEDDLFPRFVATEPDQATTLLAEHSELRRSLSEMGVALELHAVPVDAAQALIDRLRSHEEKESRLFYPSIEDGIPDSRSRR